MCKVIGTKDTAQLMDETVPKEIRNRPPLKVGKALTETEALDKLEKMVSTNQVYKSYIGMGYYNTILNIGLDEYCAAGVEVGLDGIIAADLPAAEAGPFRMLATNMVFR